MQKAVVKMKEELEYTKGFLNSVNKKLQNEKFVAAHEEEIQQVTEENAE